MSQQNQNQNREDRGQIGATNNSPPRPSPTPQVYQPFEVPGAFAIELHKKVTVLSNRLDILILRVNFLEEAIAGLMEDENTDKDLVDWFQRNRERLQRLSKQQEQHQQRF